MTNTITGSRIVLAALCLAAAPSGTWAMGSCSGQYSAAALKPLPQPTVATIDVFDNSPRNLQLSQALTRGMNNAGLATAGSGNVRLSVSYTLTGGGGGGYGRVRNSYDQWGAQSQWGGMSGGVSIEQPGMPRFGAAPSAGPQTLMLRADLRDTATGLPLWIATIQCQVQTGNEQQLAYDIGTLIGQSAGKRIDRSSM
ncbi:MAG: hypothetical protein J0H14_03775 [Alphaproteobacteria bacterium]|nr:hypothetical protein [Rhodospirillales bacterium]MBN9559834.1 hypothetical protein [Alphaproteobacteria bacterium]